MKQPILKKNKKNSIIAATLFFIYTFLSIYFEFFYALLLPFAALFVYLFILNYKLIFYIAIFFIPLSFPVREFFPDTPIDLSLPSEPILIALTVVFVLQTIKKNDLNRKILMHPLSVTIFLYLIWMLLTSISSSMPMVSFKYLISRFWFIIPSYFFILLFDNKNTEYTRFLNVYLIALLIIIAQTFIRHIPLGLLNKDAAHFVMNPFYNDHTAYGAILAMFIPIVYVFIKKQKQNIYKKIFYTISLILLIAAFIFSYSRAAWISLLGALIIAFLIIYKIRLSYLIVLFAIFSFIVYSFRFEIIDRLEKNKQDSSDELMEHVQSISNIASDASNLERLNRWDAAFAMFAERPLFGWGVATYQFQYAPFQKSENRTIISTNFGDVGNAHSEYIGPLAEQGFFGLILILVIFAISIKTGIKAYRKSINEYEKMFILAIIVGLVSYYIHGFLNNFLDTIKLAIPVWTFMGILVGYDLKLNSKSDN